MRTAPTVLTVLAFFTFTAFAMAADTPGNTLTVYHLGNSLTRNIPVERLQQLFASRGVAYDYGLQLGGGHRLEQHLSKRNHGNAPGEGEYNTIEKYGEYDQALKNHTFDAVVLQPYMSVLDKEPEITPRWPYYSCGDLQAASAFIDYARGRTAPGSTGWHELHANTNHCACERFYIYATWPSVPAVLEQPDAKTYAHFYAGPYKGGVRICKDFFIKLVDGLNERHPDLPTPVRLIPAGEVLAELDQKIRAGELPGIEAFYERNQPYFIKSRRNNKKPSLYDPDEFNPSNGVLNVYADNVHMNDQPHNGKDSGTIGSYIAALTVYATLSGQSPVGLTAKPYEQFDEKADAELITVLQETVWEVVRREPRTGVRDRQ